MNNKNTLNEMFLNKSNEYFKNHIKDLEYSLSNADIDYINYKDTNLIFDKLITCYCSNLSEDIKWMSEDDDDYYEYLETISK